MQRSFVASFLLILLSILAVWTAASCSRTVPDDAASERAVSFALSLKNVLPGQEYSTKMTSDITQSGGVFRGIERLYVIPFNTEENLEVEPQDSRLGTQNVVLGNTGISRYGLVPVNNSHLFGTATIPGGMNHVLTYGKAPDEGVSASKESKHLYGVLNQEGLSDPLASDDISFHLEPVLSSGDTDELTQVESVCDGLLSKLNVVMSLLGSSQNANVGIIFDNVKRENQILACSYQVFNQIRSEIQSALWSIPYESDALLQEVGLIQNAVAAFSESLSQAGSAFPNQYGIPEGSVGFWWDGKQFVRLIGGVNIALVAPSSYCYPPSLWYYANSAIKTSEKDDVKTEYVQSNETWEDILVHYTDGQSVNSSTQAVAVVDQLQYGVALLELSLMEPGSEAASLIRNCPLTGIIIGDQRDVDFRFLPSQGQTYYIYDTNVSGLRVGSTTGAVQTLVLQTRDNEEVHFALEFRNTTGVTRHCQQGDILPSCRFYLAGVLKLSDGSRPQSSTETFNSVFSRDHKTLVKVKIDGLRNAYNTVPDLHSPQLEIGLVTEMKWSQLTPQSLVLDF